MEKGGVRDEKRQYRLSLLGIQSDRSDESSDSDDGRTDGQTNEHVESSSPSGPPSPQTCASGRAEKQASRPSMFRARSSFLIGGELKSRMPSVSRIPSVARMPSRSSIMSDVETGGIMRGKEPRPREGPVGNNQRNESFVSIPGAFRMHPNGTVDDDPTVYSQNTKETNENPFVIDHASLIDNPDLRAHLASGGAIPTDLQGTNSATGGPAPGRGVYPMPSYALSRITTPMAMPSMRTPEAPIIGEDMPVTRRRNQDGLMLNQRQIRLIFLMLAMTVVAVVTGVVVAIGSRDEQQRPVNSVVVESTPWNEKPLEWNDDGTSPEYSNDAKDVLNDYINTNVFPTLSPTALIKDSKASNPTAAPTLRATSKPTVDQSHSPTHSPTTSSPTPLPTTPKPTEPLDTPEPSIAPTKATPSSSPSTSAPSLSPTMISSAIPSVSATTVTPTSLAPSRMPTSKPTSLVSSHPPTGMLTTLQPTIISSTQAPSEITFEMEGTITPTETNTTGSDNGDVGQNSTNTTGTIGNGDVTNISFGQNTTNATGATEDDTITIRFGENSTDTSGEGNTSMSSENATQDFWRDQASLSGEDVTQDFWRDQASIASAGDHTPLNWSE